MTHRKSGLDKVHTFVLFYFVSKKPAERTEDFKMRIARIMRERETGKRFSVVGGPRANNCVVIQTTKPEGTN